MPGSPCREAAHSPATWLLHPKLVASVVCPENAQVGSGTELGEDCHDGPVPLLYVPEASRLYLQLLGTLSQSSRVGRLLRS